MLRIVTDGAVDMPENWVDEYQIDVIPLMVRFGEQIYTPGNGFSNQDFYQLVVENRTVPKSSLPSPEQIKAYYRDIAEKGDEVLSIHIASKMSGTFSAVQTAANELISEYKIYVFDSGAGSAAMGFMCRQARVLSRAGVSICEIVHQLNMMKDRITVIFTLNNLEFAYLSGRVSMMQNALSSLMQVKPIIVLRDGLLQMAEKVRTRQRAIERIIGYVSENNKDKLISVAVVHAQDLSTAQHIVSRLKAWLNVKEIIVTELAIPVAANLGPGTVGIVVYPMEMG